MLKIEKQKLINFLDKVKIGTNVTNVLFNFTNQGLEINTIDTTKVALIKGMLKRECFKEYEEIGEIGVQNLQEIITILKSFNKELIISKSENLLIIKEGKYKLETEVVDPEFIEKVPESPNLEFNEKAEINASDINLFIKTININKKLELNVETQEKKIIFSNSGKYKFTKELECNILSGGFKGSYGKLFEESIAPFNDKIVLNMNKEETKGYPIQIYEKTEDSIISIIIAPIVNNE